MGISSVVEHTTNMPSAETLGEPPIPLLPQPATADGRVTPENRPESRKEAAALAQAALLRLVRITNPLYLALLIGVFFLFSAIFVSVAP
jgi:hypothetical protein